MARSIVYGMVNSAARIAAGKISCIIYLIIDTKLSPISISLLSATLRLILPTF